MDQSRGKFVVHGNATVIVVEAAPGAQLASGSGSSSRNPYKGLAAFRETDAGDFFGRESLVRRLWVRFAALHRQGTEAPQTRFLAILGPSGSGKSSVARAGLIPALAGQPVMPQANAHVVVFTPGARPLESLAAALARTGSEREGAPVAALEAELAHLGALSTPSEYASAPARPAPTSRDHLVLLVDQFEELYTLCRDEGERTQFVELLLRAAAEPQGSASVIITLRTDFVEETSVSDELSRLIADQSVLVPVMSRDDLRSAITGPAHREGREIDAATVELLVESARQREGMLPLLQFALTRIWEGLANGEEPAATLQRLGGIGGALAQTASELYAALPSVEDKAVARRAFLRLANVPRDEDAPATRRRLPLRELVGHSENEEHVKVVLMHFADPVARVITFSADANGGDTVEITHEALLEHWTELAGWIMADRHDLRFHDQLAAASRHWKENGWHPNLLWRPPDLDRLHEFYRRRDADLIALEKKFYQASARAYARRRLAAFAAPAAFVAFAAGAWLIGQPDKVNQPDVATRSQTTLDSAVSPAPSRLVSCPPPSDGYAMGSLNGSQFLRSYQRLADVRLDATQSFILNTLIDAINRDACMKDVRWAAYVLATIKYESGDTFRPVEEYDRGTGQSYGQPVTVRDSLGNTYTNTYYGRGYVQLTWADNYRNVGRAIGLGDELLLHPERALEPGIAYAALSYSMRGGFYTGKRLENYLTDSITDYRNARRIINGLDRADRLATDAQLFETALRESASGPAARRPT
ncbi:hypothetical protein [Longimicrobium sp.]|uniref:nSTAND1 domain-containing NTPase n=1 Tax=Longimicrobium sp. TaxID=2029185 RepID=UPI002ED8425D